MESKVTLRLEPVQARSAPATNYANAFVDELEVVYGRGIHELSEVVAAFNETGLRPPDGSAWTEQSFVEELARLGKKERDS